MKILQAIPVRQDEETFKRYLESLDNLEKPCEIDRLFILHNSANLIPLIKNAYYIVYNTEDEYIKDETSHKWTSRNVKNISDMKNIIAKYVVDNGYDYVFMVDTDLVLHPKTLVQLVEAKKDIVAEIFWTKWSPEGQPLPNCWMFDSYDGFGIDNVEQWSKPGLYRVGMTGACILIHRKVFESGVNYNDIYNISYDGEDRFFCIRAACAGFNIWIDTHYPAIHLYRISELDKYIENGAYKGAFSI